jgi:hypothetical protein
VKTVYTSAEILQDIITRQNTSIFICNLKFNVLLMYKIGVNTVHAYVYG